MTEKIFWIIFYYGICLVSFMIGITVFACLYKHICEPFIIPKIAQLLSKRRWRFMKCVWPRMLCPHLYRVPEIKQVNEIVEDITLV